MAYRNLFECNNMGFQLLLSLVFWSSCLVLFYILVGRRVFEGNLVTFLATN